MNNIDQFLSYNNSDATPHLFEIIIPDAACNMKCKYCFGEHSCNIRNTCNSKLNEKALDESLKNIDHSSPGIITVWGGEPFYNKSQFLELVSYLTDRFPKAELSIVTNGSLLTDYWTQFIIDNNIIVGISHDGPGQKYRGFDCLEHTETKNNIIQLRKNKRFFAFNTIIHKLSPSIQETHEYYYRKEDELGVELGTAPRLIRYVNELSEPFMFRSADFYHLDKNAEYVTNFFMRALLNNDVKSVNKYLGDPLKHAITSIIENLSGIPFTWVKDTPYCGTLDVLKITTNGDKVFCNGITETGDIEKAKKMLSTYKSFSKCETCDTNYVCKGLCSALPEHALMQNCEMYQYFYTKLREYIESFMKK